MLHWQAEHHTPHWVVKEGNAGHKHCPIYSWRSLFNPSCNVSWWNPWHDNCSGCSEYRRLHQVPWRPGHGDEPISWEKFMPGHGQRSISQKSASARSLGCSVSTFVFISSIIHYDYLLAVSTLSFYRLTALISIRLKNYFRAWRRKFGGMAWRSELYLRKVVLSVSKWRWSKKLCGPQCLRAFKAGSETQGTVRFFVHFQYCYVDGVFGSSK